MNMFYFTYRPSRIAVCVLALIIVLSSCRPADTLSGVVRDESGPVSGAVVRVQTSEVFAVTDAGGRFTLSGLTPGEPVSLSAWAPGYYIAGGEEFTPGGGEIELTLTSHPTEDDPDYAWLSAFAEAGEEANCQNCHASLLEEGEEASLPFDEWQRDPHARAAQNPRFLTMYGGTDMDGNQSPPTRYGYNRDYGRFPLPPNPNKPYYGPGYKLDFPETAGNCAACHTPAAAVNASYGTDPRTVTGVGAEGAACDFCHKIWDVKLGADGLPYPNMPGVLSFEFRRPPEGHQFFAGPFDDVAPGDDTYVPLYAQGQYCAPCHFGAFWNVQIYNSFGEWLESPYSDPETGQTCQDCHMPPGQNDHFVRLEKGGRQRDPDSIFSHDMTVTPDLLRQAVTMDVQAERREGQVVVTVTLTNTGAGHHVPTDSPLRQMILLVQAVDSGGAFLPLVEGTRIPAWGGVGDPAQGYYAGLPGAL
ncbi:MAG: hypothetical protein GXP40_00690, partial [Chloroflexi bacterium]|nr:hypothetical protein [Chloroflexota bacterium]